MEHFDSTFASPVFNEYNDGGDELYAMPAAVEPVHGAAPLATPDAILSSSNTPTPLNPGMSDLGPNFPSPLGSPSFQHTTLGPRFAAAPSGAPNFKLILSPTKTEHTGVVGQASQLPNANQSFAEQSQRAALNFEAHTGSLIENRPRRANYQVNYASSTSPSDEGVWPSKRRKTGETPPPPEDASAGSFLNKTAFSPEEDVLISDLYDALGDEWVKISEALQTNRDPQDVKDRWRKLREKARRKSRRASIPTVSRSLESIGGRLHRYPINKRFWTQEEDDRLRELVEQHGAYNWPEIARNMDGRSDNDCHSRWSRHLDPRLNKSAFTPDEDEQIIQLQLQMGNKWKEIAVRLNTNRSGVQIHGRWLHLSKKERRGEPAPAPGKSKRGRKPGSGSALGPKKRGRKPGVRSDATAALAAAAAGGAAAIVDPAMHPSMNGGILAGPLSTSIRGEEPTSSTAVHASSPSYMDQVNATGTDGMSSYEEYDEISSDWHANGPSFDESEAAAISDY